MRRGCSMSRWRRTTKIADRWNDLQHSQYKNLLICWYPPQKENEIKQKLKYYRHCTDKQKGTFWIRNERSAANKWLVYVPSTRPQKTVGSLQHLFQSTSVSRRVTLSRYFSWRKHYRHLHIRTCYFSRCMTQAVIRRSPSMFRIVATTPAE